MRVQVTKEDGHGPCMASECEPYKNYDVPVHRMTVYLGNNFEKTDWLCNKHYAQFEQAASFDIEQVPIDTSGPPDRRTKRTSRRNELEIAAKLGGRRQPGSGNQPFAKGDVRKKGFFRVEVKECFGLEFGVHRRDLLDKIRSECSKGEQPAVVVTFRDRGTHEALESWAIIPFELWETYANAAGTNR
jgi:hypothetical protein